MVKKSQTNTGNHDFDELNSPPSSDSDIPSEMIPEGFHTVNARRDASWWKPEPGMVIQGVLMGRYSRMDEERKRYYYQMQVTKRCQASVYNENEREWEDGIVDRGGFVNVDERADLQGLMDLCDDKQINEVWIKAVEKVKVKGSSRNFWRFEVAARILKSMPTGFEAKSDNQSSEG